jgi:hypothetical protein
MEQDGETIVIWWLNNELSQKLGKSHLSLSQQRIRMNRGAKGGLN